MLQIVTEENIEEAALIHQLSWKESHQSFCSKEFIDAHTTSTQMEYIRNELLKGKRFFLLNLNEEGGKGIVSVHHNLIENLYVLPDQQRKGYGELLLKYAEKQCEGTPTLWILSNNDRAKAFYLKNGFDFTGERKELKGGLAELEMKHQKGVKRGEKDDTTRNSKFRK